MGTMKNPQHKLSPVLRIVSIDEMIFGLFQPVQPFLHLGLAATNFMSIDTELAGDIGLGEGTFHVADAGGQAAALVGGEGDDGLAVEVDVFK